MTTTISEIKKYSILLKENGFKKLETFLKIAITRDEEVFIEINPEEDTIKLSCIDPSHVSNVIGILDNENDDDFEIENLSSILQFNLKSQDIHKILMLNSDSDILIVPNIDKKNNFDSLKFMISQNNTLTKEIFVPIYEATNDDLFNNSHSLIENLLEEKDVLVLRIQLDYFIELLKESEVFNNERLRFNIKTNGKTIEKISIETFDTDTDKTRRIKNNLFEGLHFARTKLNTDDTTELDYNVLVGYSDLKKMVVTSKLYSSVNLILKQAAPLCILYSNEIQTNIVNTITVLLAPIIKEQEQPVE